MLALSHVAHLLHLEAVRAELSRQRVSAATPPTPAHGATSWAGGVATMPATLAPAIAPPSFLRGESN